MRVFFAFPFTDLICPQTHIVDSITRSFIASTIAALTATGHSVFSAHVREKWGAKLCSPGAATCADLSEMRRADLVVAFPGRNSVSGGVHVELGWASALGKAVILFLNDGISYSPLVSGLGAICPCQVVTYTGFDVQQIVRRVVDAVNSFHCEGVEKVVSG